MVEWQCLSIFLSGLTTGWNLELFVADLVSSPGGCQSCNWCCCLTVLLSPKHPRPLHCNLCIYTMPKPPALCRPVGIQLGHLKGPGFLPSKEVSELSLFSKPWDGADPPSTSGLSLLQLFLTTASLPCVSHWKMGVGIWVLSFFPFILWEMLSVLID